MAPTSDQPGWVNLVVAMAAEAQPLVEHLRLKPAREEEPFRSYTGDRIRLVISGIGREAAAAAAGFLFAQAGAERDEGWLNVGIGGHARLPLGSINVGQRIVDVASGRAWYPPRVHEVPCPPAEIRTVSEVERRYPEPAIYEMEAAGFVAACTRFAIAEQVQVVKIISDNLASPPERADRARIGQWIAAQLPVIDTLIASLAAVAADLRDRRADPPEFEATLARWHFTVTQRHQLRDLLRRWQLVLPQVVMATAIDSATSTADVLARLRQGLAETPPRLEQEP